MPRDDWQRNTIEAIFRPRGLYPDGHISTVLDVGCGLALKSQFISADIRVGLDIWRQYLEKIDAAVPYVTIQADAMDIDTLFLPDSFFGSLNVLRAAGAADVERVVCLSTDKAVYPVNAMGMTKALMEKLVQAEARRLARDQRTTFCVVRYGNVLCSRGSVVPVFMEQIALGRPIGVTVPGMTRFLLRLDDAVDLVETALLHGRTGDIFVRKSAACTVGVLAQALLRMFGERRPVVVLGARPGEKMHETLATVEEMRSAVDCGDAWRIPADRSDLIDPDPARHSPHIGHDYNSRDTERLELGAVISLLSDLAEVRIALTTAGRRSPRLAIRAPSRRSVELQSV